MSVGITVADVQKSIAWYRDVLGCVVDEEWKQEGKVMGASMLAGAASFFIGQDDWAKGRDRKKGEGFRVHLATAQSVDEVAARIRASGGKLDTDPADMPWGVRAFSITDPDGFKITIASESA
jgi:catechol 2,3-dioxygenase-like lactoylglutathione lyase family enzyme